MNTKVSACSVLAVLLLLGCASKSEPRPEDQAAMISIVKACERSIPDPRGTGSAAMHSCVYTLSEQYLAGKNRGVAYRPPDTVTCHPSYGGSFTCTAY